MNQIDTNGMKIVVGATPVRSNDRSLIAIGTALADFAVVFGVVISSSVLYHLAMYDSFGKTGNAVRLGLLIAGIFVFTNLMQRRYSISHYVSPRGQLENAFNIWNVTMIAFIAVGFLSKTIDSFSRAVVLIVYLAGMIIVPFSRWMLVRLISIASKTGRVSAQRMMLIGRESDVMTFMSRHQPWNSGLMVNELVILQPAQPGESAAAASQRLDNEISAAVAQAREQTPDSVFIAVPWSEQALIEKCIDAFMTTPVSIHLASERILERFESPRILRTGTITSLELSSPPLSKLDIITKRAFDVVASTLGLIVLSPLFAVIALLIKLDSEGPIFFIQRRYGFNRQPFRIIKFRTMSTLDDGDTVRQAQKNDPRITRVGAVLRRWNLDELPQLLNVLAGRMSLVGPRPHALTHDREFENKIALYARRHNVRPGITGWAQIHGLRGETDTDEKMAMRVAHDLWYIDNWSFWLDVVILIRTVVSRKAFANAR